MNQRTAHITGRPRMSAIALVAITNTKPSAAGHLIPSIEVGADANKKKSLSGKEFDLGKSRLVHQPIADSAKASDAMGSMKAMKPARQINTMLAAPFLVQPVHFGQMRRNQAGTLWPARN